MAEGIGYSDVATTPRDTFWWRRDYGNEQGILESLTADFKLLSDDNQRAQAYDTYSSLYSNRRIDSGAPLLQGYDARWAMDKGQYTRVPYNLMKQVIDEASSRIIKSHPRAKFITHGGDQELQRQAKLMQRWNDAQVYQHYQSEKFELVIKDACIYGLGALKISAAHKEDRLEATRVHPGNLFVDLQETIFDRPTRIHHRRFVAKNVLMAFFPKHVDKIEASGTMSGNDDSSGLYSSFSFGMQDIVELVESWHLPSFEGAPDGRRCLWVNGTLLQQQHYKRRSFPFSFFNWKSDPNNSFYGTGLGEDLLGVHIDANVTLNRVNTAIELAAVPKWIYRQGSVEDSHLSNLPGLKVPFTGDVKPEFVLGASVPPDLLNYVREHEARAYKIAGLTSAQAFGERMPAGLETGRAVENYFNVESVPFATQLRKFEYFAEDVANCNVAAGRDIYERNNKWTVVVPGEKNTIEVLDWKEVAIEPRDDSYVIRSAPTSMLSELPSARLGEVERLQAVLPSLMGDEERTAQMLGMEDLENFHDLFGAQRENGQAMIVAALRHGKFTPPSPFMNLGTFIVDCEEAEQRAVRMGVNERNLSQLRRMTRRANELRQKETIAREMQALGAVTPAAVPTDGSGQRANEIQGQAI
jgi:hypothetical protein